MNKILSLLVLSVVLYGCESNEELEAKRLISEKLIQQNLPEGCSVNYAGDYKIPGRNIPIVYVDCKYTITQNVHFSTGKTYISSSIVKFKQLEEQYNQEKQKLESVLDKLSEEDKQILGLEINGKK